MRVNIYKRNNTYWIRYSLDGKQYRESLKTQDTTAARRIANQIEKQLLLGTHSIPQEKYPLPTFLDRYYLYAESHKRPKTVEIDRWTLKELSERVKAIFLQDVTPPVIEKYKHELKESGLSANTINIHLRHLSSILGTLPVTFRKRPSATISF